MGHTAPLVPNGTRGFSFGAEEPVGDPRDGTATSFRVSGEPVGCPSDGAAAYRQTSPHLNTPHIQHNAPHLNRARHSPCLPSGRGSQAPGYGMFTSCLQLEITCKNDLVDITQKYYATKVAEKRGNGGRRGEKRRVLRRSGNGGHTELRQLRDHLQRHSGPMFMRAKATFGTSMM